MQRCIACIQRALHKATCKPYHNSPLAAKNLPQSWVRPILRQTCSATAQICSPLRPQMLCEPCQTPVFWCFGQGTRTWGSDHCSGALAEPSCGAMVLPTTEWRTTLNRLTLERLPPSVLTRLRGRFWFQLPAMHHCMPAPFSHPHPSTQHTHTLPLYHTLMNPLGELAWLVGLLGVGRWT